eukprot:jgi/Chlat1/314/Chrsp1S08785
MDLVSTSQMGPSNSCRTSCSRSHTSCSNKRLQTHWTMPQPNAQRLRSAAAEGRWGDMCIAIEDGLAEVNKAGVVHHIVKHCTATGADDELINKALEAALSGDWHDVRRCLLRDVGWDISGEPIGASKLVNNHDPSMAAAPAGSSMTPDINAAVCFGMYEQQTALHVAVIERNVPAVSCLLRHGADAKLRNVCMQFSSPPDISMEDVSRKDEFGARPHDTRYTPLHHAVVGNDVDTRIIHALVCTDADGITRTTSHGNTPLHLFLKHGHIAQCVVGNAELDMLHALHVAGVTQNARNNEGATCLHLAAARGDESLLEGLFQLGRYKNLDVVDCGGFTPLHRAAQSGSEACVRFLLGHGSDETLITYCGKTLDHCLTGDARRWWRRIPFADKDRFNNTINALLVVAALVFSITYQGFNQPPLGWVEAPPVNSSSDPNILYLSVRLTSVRVWTVCNALSFFFAWAAISTGATRMSIVPSPVLTTIAWFAVVLKREMSPWSVAFARRQALVMAVAFFVELSLMCAAAAFTAAGMAAIPPEVAGTEYLVLAPFWVAFYGRWIVGILVATLPLVVSWRARKGERSSCATTDKPNSMFARWNKFVRSSDNDY